MKSIMTIPLAVIAFVIVTQNACIITHGVMIADHTGWVDEGDIRQAVELVFNKTFWVDASPALEIVFVTTREELTEHCKQTCINGCYGGRYSTFGDPSDIVTVLLPGYEVCLADANYSMLVHELVHRWQHDHGWPSGHPIELFGKPEDQGHGGLTGQLECTLAIDLCPWYAELSPRCSQE